MENYSDVLAQVKSAGILVDALDVDGKIHRVRVEGSREKRGWYSLTEWKTHDGRALVVGSFGVWHGNERNAQKVELSKDDLVNDADRAALKARLAEDRKRADAQRAAEAARAARRAAHVWSLALTSPPGGQVPDYLVRKGVKGYGLRYTPSGALVVPMQDARGDVHGLQFVLPKDHARVKRTGRDKEYWPAGLSKVGHWFQLGMVTTGSVVLVAEGYATAATLHEATGLPVAVAFDANNLMPVAVAIKKARRPGGILICADDDYIQKCKVCGKPTPVADKACAHCGADHECINPGCAAAAAAALAVGGAWVAPVFPSDRGGQKLTDFNDLMLFPGGGMAMVRAQIQDKIDAMGWTLPQRRVMPLQGGHAGDGQGRAMAGGAEGGDVDGISPGDFGAGAGATPPTIEGGGGAPEMVARLSVDDAAARYVGTYGFGGKMLFDLQEARLVHKDDVLNLLPSHGWDLLKNHPSWRVVRDHEIGFDPTQRDPAVRCNLYGGWPTRPRPGNCTALLDLLAYQCGNEGNSGEVYRWMLCWLAYPIQHPGAKMHSAIVVHGPQGTGKSRFFEAYAKIFGPYGRVLGQEALEDKFNADWAEKKLFILADEVLARQDMYHIKNRLKGFITGDTIRVNPKNIAAHNERNHMNIVFLSNERMPLVLENDDRRHMVIWVPPKLSDDFFAQVNEEIDAGGIEALHQYLLDLDLGAFKPWTRPPMTRAKQDLIDHGLSSEERFMIDWQRLEVYGKDDEPMPFCPCSDAHLFRTYERWCNANGERARRKQELISLAAKKPGWAAGTQHTWANLREPTDKVRKMVVPSDGDMADAMRFDRSKEQAQATMLKTKFKTRAEWLTAGFFTFESAIAPDYPQ